MNLRFLVVDDSELNLGITQIILKNKNIDSDTAKCAEDAYTLIQRNIYDAVLLDYLMPGTNGIEASAHIRQLSGGNHPAEYYRALPLIALTAEDDAEQQKMLLRTDYNDLVVKPFNVDSLEHIIKKWCNLDPSAVNIHGIDKATYQGMLSSDADAFFEIAGMFSSDIASKHERIGTALTAEDYQAYTVEVHRIKSEAKIIGAIALSQAAAMLEAVGKALTRVCDNGRSDADNIDYIKNRTPKLLHELDMTNADLTIAINRHNSLKYKQQAPSSESAPVLPEGSHVFTEKEHNKLIRYINHADESLQKGEYKLVHEWLAEIKELLNKK